MKRILYFLVLLLPLQGICQVSLIKKDESCKDKKDGSIEVVVTGIDGPFVYKWAQSPSGKVFGGNVKKVTGLEPGDYTVTVSLESGGCMDVKAAKIWPGKIFTVDISGKYVSHTPDPTLCGQRPSYTYDLTAVATGGTPPYYCSWSNSHDIDGACTKRVSGEDIEETCFISDSAGCVDGDTWTKKSLTRICSGDPNDIAGPDGYGNPKWVSVNDELNYTIRFENDPIFATSAASIVFVSVPIDDDIDPFSFRLGAIGFGDFIIEIPVNKSFYQQRLDYSETTGYLVDVTAGLDIPNQRFFWSLETIDPITGQPPIDPLAGFLPVNDTLTGSGEGFVNFVCSPKSVTLTGETVEKQATIIFDNNDPISTNTWINTVDAFAPATIPQALPDTLFTNEVQFDWTSSDDPGGCGVMFTEVLLSTDKVEFESNGFVVDSNHSALTLYWNQLYYYKIAGTDFVNNQEMPAMDSFYIIPNRTIEFLTPDHDVYCIGDTLWLDVALTSIPSVDLAVSIDTGNVFTPIASGVSTWPYAIVLDSSMLHPHVLIRARNETNSLEAMSIPFRVKTLPVVDAGDPVSGCKNEILFVEATGANNYLWAPEEIIGNVNGRYSNVYIDSSQYAFVTGTDVFGCNNTDSVFITVYPVSLDSLTQPLCEGDSILIEGDWVSEEGYYTSTYTNILGCDSTIVTEIYFESPCIWPGGPYVYVHQDATGLNNGTSWLNAFTDLQDAIYVAGRYENVQEIWVAEGIYIPHATRRDTSFVLRDSIKIYGGFLGFETSRENRTSNAELVKISGDINTADTLWDNSYHTVRMTPSCVECVLDGLTIQYGYANELSNAHDIGAGVINAGDGAFYNVIFERNYATDLGAALHSSGVTSFLIIEDCTFRLNTSSLGRDVVNTAGANLEFRGANSIH